MTMATNVHGEGQYHFEWEERESDGKIVAKCQQSVYGLDLSDALTTFLTMHGPLGADENGCSLAIVKIEIENE